MFAGPVTSALMPRLHAVTERSSIRRGAALTLAFALLASFGVVLVGPLLLPSLVTSPLPHLTRCLIPACLGGTGWAVAAYFTWVKSANGAPSGIFIGAAVIGIMFEWILGSTLNSAAAITWSPILALAVFGIAFLFPRRKG